MLDENPNTFSAGQTACKKCQIEGEKGRRRPTSVHRKMFVGWIPRPATVGIFHGGLINAVNRTHNGPRNRMFTTHTFGLGTGTVCTASSNVLAVEFY